MAKDVRKTLRASELSRIKDGADFIGARLAFDGHRGMSRQ
jgi:hypothetical protein